MNHKLGSVLLLLVAAAVLLLTRCYEEAESISTVGNFFPSPPLPSPSCKKHQLRHSVKVIGAGLGSTGTRSLFATTTAFNLTSLHFESRFNGSHFIQNVARLANSRLASERKVTDCVDDFSALFETLDAYEAIFDVPIPLYFPMIYSRYCSLYGIDRVKVILTVRNSMRWAASRIERFWRNFAKPSSNSFLYPCPTMSHERPYFLAHISEEEVRRISAMSAEERAKSKSNQAFIALLAKFYRRHVAIVRSIVPANQLLVISYFVNDLFEFKGKIMRNEGVERAVRDNVDHSSYKVNNHLASFVNGTLNPIHVYSSDQAHVYFDMFRRFLQLDYDDEAEEKEILRRLRHLRHVPYDFDILYKPLIGLNDHIIRKQ